MQDTIPVPRFFENYRQASISKQRREIQTPAFKSLSMREGK